MGKREQVDQLAVAWPQGGKPLAKINPKGGRIGRRGLRVVDHGFLPTVCVRRTLASEALDSESPAPLRGAGQDVRTALLAAQTAACLDLLGGKDRQFAREGQRIFAALLQAPKGGKGQGRRLGDSLFAGFGPQMTKVAVGLLLHAGQNLQEIL